MLNGFIKYLSQTLHSMSTVVQVMLSNSKYSKLDDYTQMPSLTVIPILEVGLAIKYKKWTTNSVLITYSGCL